MDDAVRRPLLDDATAGLCHVPLHRPTQPDKTALPTECVVMDTALALRCWTRKTRLGSFTKLDACQTIRNFCSNRRSLISSIGKAVNFSVNFIYNQVCVLLQRTIAITLHEIEGSIFVPKNSGQ
jgi:hypothetical protein